MSDNSIEIDRNEINEIIGKMHGLFAENGYSNVSVFNALSGMSVHLAVVLFGVPKEVYIKDIEAMFDEQVKNFEAVKTANESRNLQ